MPLPNNIHAYTDVARILEAALDRGGAVLKLKTKNEATRWRQRAYYYRKLLRQREDRTPYEHMILRIDVNEVRIEFDNEQQGTLMDLHGKRFDAIPDDDPLLREARRLFEEKSDGD